MQICKVYSVCLRNQLRTLDSSQRQYAEFGVSGVRTGLLVAPRSFQNSDS
jgi:hypothetical protein